MKKIILVTSLYRLRKHRACSGRYDHLVSKLGPKWGYEDEINLLDILEHNGTADCLWALCAVVKHPEADRVMRLMAADFAEVVLPIYEKEYPNDDRPRKTIEAARKYANGEITAAAWAAASDAARAAARAAASAAAWDAARDAASAAARAAASAAAWDAARDAASAAASAAARAAASAAAWDAASAAASAAARDAASAAASAAARDAASAAARDAASAAARDAQSDIIRKYLRRK